MYKSLKVDEMNVNNFNCYGQLCLDKLNLKVNLGSFQNLPDSVSIESQPQKTEFRHNPETFTYIYPLNLPILTLWVKVHNFQNPEL